MRHTSCQPTSGSWLKLFPRLFISPPVHILSRFVYKQQSSYFNVPHTLHHVLHYLPIHRLSCPYLLFFTYSFLLLRASGDFVNTIFMYLSTQMQFLHNTSNIYAHLEELRYKPEGRRFDFRWYHWKMFRWNNASGRNMAPGSNRPLTEMSTRKTSWWAKVDVAYGWLPYHSNL